MLDLNCTCRIPGWINVRSLIQVLAGLDGEYTCEVSKPKCDTIYSYKQTSEQSDRYETYAEKKWLSQFKEQCVYSAHYFQSSLITVLKHIY